MNRCPKCGKMFEGSFCPECGRSLTGERLCPNCKKKVPATAKFCAECGFTLTPQAQPKVKKTSPLDWIKEHKKLVGFGVFVLILIVILAIAIPSVVANRHNGTYYRYENEQYNYDEYFILKGDKYTDESGYSCDVKFDGDNITLYDDLFGIKDEFARGTIKDGVLTLNILGAVVTYAEKGAMHEHEFGGWTVQTPSTCIKYGTEMRSCKSCDKTETRAITQLASHKGSWEVTKEATCTETGTRKMHCSVCGQDFSETIGLRAHKFEKWDYDENNHWTVCSVCKTANSNKSAHKYEEWSYDENDHWIVCSVCKKMNSDKGAHQFSASQQCETCGYEQGTTAGLSYKIENNECTVTGLGFATDTEIVIPSHYNGKPVTLIGTSAFEDCSELTSIIIPNSVTTIGSWAFYHCSGLTSFDIPDSVVSIGDRAFYGCDGLISVVIGDGVTSIGHYAFYGCSGLTSIDIPDSVTYIGARAFENCSGLKGKLKIPNSVTSIGLETFSGCSGLTSITIPDSVTEIGERAFEGCSGLTSIDIPDSVTSIGYGAFSGCIGLISVTIPDSVTSIGSGAFAGCNALKEVHFKNPNGWKVSKNENMSETKDVSGLNDPATATKYLTDTYSYYYWKRG